MRVLDRPEVRPLAVDAARADHRDLALEIDERFEDRLAGGRAPSHAARGVVRRRDRHLALAVVAERRRLQHRRAADRRDAPCEIRRRCGPARTASPAGRGRRETSSRACRCCAIVQRAAVRPDDRVLLRPRPRPPPARSRTRTSRRRRRCAKARTASRSSYGALISTSAICPVGVSCSGASVWTR